MQVYLEMKSLNSHRIKTEKDAKKIQNGFLQKLL